MGASITGTARYGAPPLTATGTSAARSDDIPLTESVPEDVLLLRQMRRGQREAFEAIVARHQRAVYGYLRARLLEPADAEDLCQEVFLRCYSGQVKFDRALQLRPWLIGIGRNVLREHVRRKARTREVAWTEMCLELDSLAAEETAASATALEHLPRCLEELGQSARQALDMRYGASLRLAEIGERLHRSEGAVKLLVFRARQALRKCLDYRLLQS
jgi:RNA polymerase sigma-70 factor (ECF subfamily)